VKKTTKEEIRAAVAKLKENPTPTYQPSEPNVGKLSSKKSSQRIRKQGV